ncbi:MAG: hypothetical protein KBS70_05910 [Bacteroidales bacterium]|nr:hypothetical protein [Candidatus Colicola equi]
MRKSIVFLALTLCAGLWAQNKPDTIRIYNDILIMYQIHNPQTWEVVGWSYNSHDDGGTYTFISTNQLEKFGTFSIAEGTIDTLNQWNVVRFASRYDTLRTTFVEGQMTVAEIGDSIVLDGEFKGGNNNVYLFHCTHLSSALNTDTDIDIDKKYEYYDMFSYIENGVATIELESAEIVANLELYINPDSTDIPAGTYPLSSTKEVGTARASTGMEEPEPQLCYAATMDTLCGIMRDFWYMTEGSITITYDKYHKMNVEVNTKNSYNRSCHLTVTHHHVKPIDSIVIEEDVDFAMGIYPLKQQFYMCQIFEQKSPLAVFLIRTNDISGDFTKEICLPGSFIQTQDGYYRGIIDFEQCTVTKVGKDMQMEARFIANDSILYIIRGTGYEGAIIGDCKTDYECHYLAEDISGIKYYSDTCWFSARNKNFDRLEFAFMAQYRSDNTIVPGVYTEIIQGGNWDRDAEAWLPSYINYYSQMWYIQSGTLTVNADGSMSFEGLNSYDRTVKFTVTAKSTALPSTSTSSSSLNKFLYNGQLYIRKNGKAYNAVGVEL